MNSENIFAKQIDSPDTSEGQLEKLKPVEPNLEDKYAINQFNDYLEDELRALNLSFSPVAPESIKIYRRDDFEKIKPDAVAREALLAAGICFGQNQEIIIKRTTSSEQYHDLLHGMIKHFLADRNLQQTGGAISQNENATTGFANGIAENLAVEILNKHRSELLANLPSLSINSSRAQMAKSNFFRNISAEGAFVNSLIKRGAFKGGSDPEKLWQSLKQEFLRGGLENCREIENIFGTGSLKILAKRGQGADIDSLVYRYFMSDDEIERDRIKEKLQTPAPAVRQAA
ncbi:MAG: hypothetical protein WC467_02345 [Patescibacteria group bacterium]